MHLRTTLSLLPAASLLALLSTTPAAQAAGPQEPSMEVLLQRLATYERLLSDWAGLNRYGNADAELDPPAPGETRVVFLGDQFIEFWGREENGGFFPGRSYLNRGINLQTTGQMLVRFRQDVIALEPAVVVIQGGANDLSGVGGPGTHGTIMDNVMSMVELARAHDIAVVLSAITPVCNCLGNQISEPSQMRIGDVNDEMRAYAESQGVVFVDYYSALADGLNFRSDLTADGLVPNAAGYRVMAPLVEAAIERALAAR